MGQLRNLTMPLLMIILSPALYSQDIPADLIEQLRKQYALDDWKSSEVRDGIPLGGLELKGWNGGELRSNAGLLRRKFEYEGGGSLLIEAFVGESTAKGQEQLLKWLSLRQSPEPAQKLERDEVKIGDISFFDRAGLTEGQGEEPQQRDDKKLRIGTFYTVQGNVAVRITNLDPRAHPDLSILNVSKEVVERIKQRPVVGEGKLPPAPEIQQFSAKPQRVKAGEPVVLEVMVKDPAGGTPEIQWRVGGPGQGYVERSKDGTLYLHTTKQGRITLTLEVTGSQGTVKSSSAQIEVLPRRQRP